MEGDGDRREEVGTIRRGWDSLGTSRYLALRAAPLCKTAVLPFVRLAIHDAARSRQLTLSKIAPDNFVESPGSRGSCLTRVGFEPPIQGASPLWFPWLLNPTRPPNQKARR